MNRGCIYCRNVTKPCGAHLLDTKDPKRIIATCTRDADHIGAHAACGQMNEGTMMDHPLCQWPQDRIPDGMKRVRD